MGVTRKLLQKSGRRKKAFKGRQLKTAFKGFVTSLRKVGVKRGGFLWFRSTR